MGSKGNLLITRPRGQHKPLCAAVESAGFRAHCQPLLELTALSDLNNAQRRVLLELDSYQHIIFISGNAVRFGMAVIGQYWPQLPVSLNWYAVGEATAGLLRDFALCPITQGREMTSESLLDAPELQQVEGQKVLIVKGVGGRATLAQTLAARGAQVDELACYTRSRPSMAPGDLGGLIQEWDIQLILISSGEGLSNMLALLNTAETTKFDHITVVVPSERVAQQAKQAGLPHILVAENASDAAMLSALQNYRPVTESNE